MRALAPDVHLITGIPPYAINCYLVGDVLVDAMARPSARRILKQLRGRRVTAHALTHAHPDHQGATHAVCTALDIPLWAGGFGHGPPLVRQAARFAAFCRAV